MGQHGTWFQSQSLDIHTRIKTNLTQQKYSLKDREKIRWKRECLCAQRQARTRARKKVSVAIKYFICVIEFHWVIVLTLLRSQIKNEIHAGSNRMSAGRRSETYFFFRLQFIQWIAKQVLERCKQTKNATHFYGRTKKSTRIYCVGQSGLPLFPSFWNAFSFIFFFLNKFLVLMLRLLLLLILLLVAHILKYMPLTSNIFSCSLYFSIIHFVVISVRFI